MKHLSFILFLVFAISFSSCSNRENEIRKDIELLQSKPIIIPLGKEGYPIELKKELSQKKYKLIVLYDSTECSSCRLRELENLTESISKLSSYDKNVGIYFIFCPASKNRDIFNFTLKEISSNKNIIVDYNHYFLKSNPRIPKNPQLHSFLVNKNDSVVLVGNPLTNHKVKELFFTMIDKY